MNGAPENPSTRKTNGGGEGSDNPAPRSPLSHLDESGAARQVDISAKAETSREARARSVVAFPPAAYEALKDQRLAKGDALAVARVAGIQAAKETPRLIPLCHQVPLSGCSVDFAFDDASRSVRIEARAKCVGRTGVEMEALAAASVAALALYDMAKSVDKGIIIRETRLLTKSGGKSGDWSADDSSSA